MLLYGSMSESEEPIPLDPELFEVEGDETFRSYLLKGRETATKELWFEPYGRSGIGRRFVIDIDSGENPDAYDCPTLFINIDPNYGYDLSPSDLIGWIELEVRGSQVDTIYQYQMEALMALYRLTWTYEDQCLVVPLPFDLFHGRNLFFSRGLEGDPRLRFEFLDHPYGTGLITSIRLRLGAINIYDDLEGLCNRQIEALMSFPCYSDSGLNYGSISARNQEGIPSLMYKTQFYGADWVPCEGRFRIRFNINHTASCLYFFFADDHGRIMTDPVFGHLRLWLDDQIYHDADYDSLSLSNKGQELCGMDGLYWLSLTDQHPLIYDPEAIDLCMVDYLCLDFDYALASCKLNLHYFVGTHYIFMYCPDGSVRLSRPY